MRQVPIMLAIAVMLTACNTAGGSLDGGGSPFGPPEIPGAPSSPGGGANGLCTLPLPDGDCPDTPTLPIP